MAGIYPIFRHSFPFGPQRCNNVSAAFARKFAWQIAVVRRNISAFT
jgi:hypothetical protein